MENYFARNPLLRYSQILTDVKQRINDRILDQYDLKIPREAALWEEERPEKIKELGQMGVVSMNDDTTLYLNRVSPACRLCKEGFGPTVPVTVKCNRRCFFCFIPKKDLAGTGGQDQLKVTPDFDFWRRTGTLNFAVTGGEPLLYPDRALELLRQAGSRANDFQTFETRLYTNGDLITEDILKKLRDAGLHEIRFGIKHGEFDILDKMAMASRYIPRVMMEGPVFPEVRGYMTELLDRLDGMGIFGINLLELVFRNNPAGYKKRQFQLRYKHHLPFYEPWEAQGFPVYGCEQTIFDLLEHAAARKLSLSVHYCSNRSMMRTMARGRYEAAVVYRKPHEAVTRDGLLKSLVVYEPDAVKAQRDLADQGVPESQIRLNPEKRRLETHPGNLHCLDGKGYEIGVVYETPNKVRVVPDPEGKDGAGVELKVTPERVEARVEVIQTAPSERDCGTVPADLFQPDIWADRCLDIQAVYQGKAVAGSPENDGIMSLLDGYPEDEGRPVLDLARFFLLVGLEKFDEALATGTLLEQKGYGQKDFFAAMAACCSGTGQEGKAEQYLSLARNLS